MVTHASPRSHHTPAPRYASSADDLWAERFNNAFTDKEAVRAMAGDHRALLQMRYLLEKDSRGASKYDQIKGRISAEARKNIEALRRDTEFRKMCDAAFNDTGTVGSVWQDLGESFTGLGKGIVRIPKYLGSAVWNVCTSPVATGSRMWNSAKTFFEKEVPAAYQKGGVWEATKTIGRGAEKTFLGLGDLSGETGRLLVTRDDYELAKKNYEQAQRVYTALGEAAVSEDLKEMREASDRLLEAEQALGIQRDRAADTASATTIKTVSTALVAAKGATAVAGARGATSPFMTGAGSEIAKAASVAKGLFKKMPGLGRAGSAYGSFKTSLADAAAGNGIVGTLRGLGGKCGNAAKWFDRTGWAAGVTRAAPWYLKPLGWALHAGTWAAKWATLPVWVFPAAAGKIVLPVVASSIKQAAWLGSRAGLPIAEFGANASIKGAKYSPAAVYMEGASAAADSLHETNVLDSDVVLLAQIEPDRWGQIYADHEKKVRALQEKFQTGKIGQEEYSRRYDALALEWKQNFREFIGNFEAAGITQRNLVDAASTLSTAEWNQLQADFYGIYRIEEELKKREAQEEAREKWVALLAERRESVTGTE